MSINDILNNDNNITRDNSNKIRNQTIQIL